MPVATTADLLAALRLHRLLDPARLAEAEGPIARQCPDPRALARELVRYGWLTAYQAEQLLRGDGRGLTLGSYVLLDKLGEGGMGAVFKARHSKLGRAVALKVIRKERLGSEAAVKRFRREIRAAAQLDHPNVVLAYDADEDGGTHFFAMELVEGTDLARLVKQRGPLPVREACDYVRQAALGLQHAFERGLVHRDVKPANLLLTAAGVVKLLDLGLARLEVPEGGESSSTLTQEGTAMGTPDYMAPEQALRAHEADIRADLYALGGTLFSLLTGRVPFAGGSATEKLLRRQVEAAPDVRARRPDVPEPVAAVVAKLLARRPEERYQTPAELAFALADVFRARPAAPPAGGTAAERTLADPADNPFANIDVPTGDRTAALPAVGPRRGARRPLVLAAAVSGLLLAGVLAAVFWPGAGRPPGGGPLTSAERQPTPQEVAAEAERQRRAEADDALKTLVEKAADPRMTFAEFAGDVAAFKAKFGGTPAANRAAGLLMKLPSPLDQLDPAKIPEDAKAEWQALGYDGKDVVAVLGDHTRRHWGPAWSVAYSPDGKLFATGGDDPAVRVWDSATLQQRAMLKLVRDRPRNLAWTPDSRQLFIASHDATLWLRDVASDRPPRAFQGNKHHSWSVAVSGDGRRVWGGGYDHNVHVWEVESGQELRSFEGHKGWVNGIATFGDGRYGLSGSSDGTIRLWDLEADKEVRRFEGLPQDDPVTCLAISSDGKRALSGQYEDALVRVWDVETGKQVGRLEGHTAAVTSVRYSTDGNRAISGSSDATIRLWDLATGKELCRFTGHQRWVQGVSLSPDGKQAVSGGDDGVVRVWDVATAQEVQPLDTTRNPGNWTFSPDGRHAAFAIDKTLYVWDLTGWREERRLEGHANPIRSAAFTPDGKRLLSGDNGGFLFLWEVDTGKTLSQAKDREQVNALSFAADGRHVLTAPHGEVVLWDVEGRQETAAFETGTPGFVVTTLLTPDGRRAIAGANDSTIHIWDVAGRRKVRRLDKAYWNPALSPDGRLLAYLDTNTWRIQLWNLEKDAPAEPSTIGEGDHCRDLTFAPDGKQLAATYDDAHLRLYDVATGKKLREWQMPAPAGTSFAPDGRHLAVGNINGTVYVLRLDTPPAARP
jgi:WD40 repeat protein/tRNA A-37 threonylcarbamoyl transferase component Bud32